MLGNQDWKSMLSNAEQYLAIFYYIYGSLRSRDRDILSERQKRRHILFVLSLQSILFMRRTRFVLHYITVDDRNSIQDDRNSIQNDATIALGPNAI
jgi:hypothetical protein